MDWKDSRFTGCVMLIFVYASRYSYTSNVLTKSSKLLKTFITDDDPPNCCNNA